MVVLASRFVPELLNVTVCEPLNGPPPGDITGVALVCTDPSKKSHWLPLPAGVLIGPSSTFHHPKLLLSPVP
jgi:hypothetical protein